MTKILVTGANGFVGSHTVSAALAQGCEVVAFVRRAFEGQEWISHPKLCIVVGEIGDANLLNDALSDVDAVIHTAACMTCDEAGHKENTIKPTQAVIDAILNTSKAIRLVLVSSISVYDYQAIPNGSSLTETSLLEENPKTRDAYCRAKIKQEALVYSAAELGLVGWIMRPGLIVDKDHLSSSHIGPTLGPVQFCFGRTGQIPVTEVGNCVDALVLASMTSPNGIEAVNVTDSNLPNRRNLAGYLKLLRGTSATVFLPLGIWQILLSGLGFLPWIGQRLPGLLRAGVFNARMKPLTFPNDVARARLKWTPDGTRLSKVFE